MRLHERIWVSWAAGRPAARCTIRLLFTLPHHTQHLVLSGNLRCCGAPGAVRTEHPRHSIPSRCSHGMSASSSLQDRRVALRAPGTVSCVFTSCIIIDLWWKPSSGRLLSLSLPMSVFLACVACAKASSSGYATLGRSCAYLRGPRRRHDAFQSHALLAFISEVAKP
ncbi:hypothetical protein C8Q78DRAFT_813601 [Trametes maxima]|nr:hypothetical protein C8Q78DRAFT_813601 [Trametes maxima]